MASVVQWHTRRVAASGLLLFYVFRRRNSKKRWRNRKVWVKPYIARNPFLSVYNTLVQELRAEDKAAFKNFFADGSSLLRRAFRNGSAINTETGHQHAPEHPSRREISPYLAISCDCWVFFFLLCIHIIVGYTYFCWPYEQSYAIQQRPETSLISQYYGLYSISTLCNNK